MDRGSDEKWINRKMDRQKDKQSCKLTIDRLTFAISACHKNTGNDRIYHGWMDRWTDTLMDG